MLDIIFLFIKELFDGYNVTRMNQLMGEKLIFSIKCNYL